MSAMKDILTRRVGISDPDPDEALDVARRMRTVGKAAADQPTLAEADKIETWATRRKAQIERENADLDRAAKDLGIDRKDTGAPKPKPKPRAKAKAKAKTGSRSGSRRRGVGSSRPVRETESAAGDVLPTGGAGWRFLGITIFLVIAYMALTNARRFSKLAASTGNVVEAAIYPAAAFPGRAAKRDKEQTRARSKRAPSLRGTQ